MMNRPRTVDRCTRILVGLYRHRHASITLSLLVWARHVACVAAGARRVVVVATVGMVAAVGVVVVVDAVVVVVCLGGHARGSRPV